MASCTEGNTQYGSQESCEAFCIYLAPGSAGDTDGDTLSCRAYHANAAAADPDLHCKHAGPSGGDVCGTTTGAFCYVAPLVCPDHVDGLTCEEIVPQVEAGDYMGPDSTGDTVACRLYHLTEAAGNRELHCPHVGESSPVCGTR